MDSKDGGKRWTAELKSRGGQKGWMKKGSIDQTKMFSKNVNIKLEFFEF